MSLGFHGQISVDLDKIYREVAPELVSPQNASEETIQERRDQITQSACFGLVALRRFPRSQSYHTREYILAYLTRIRITSAYQNQPASGFSELLLRRWMRKVAQSNGIIWPSYMWQRKQVDGEQFHYKKE
ncbi:MAG: hypothetical protein WCE68_11985 [Anaerolineales bacterium]